MIINFGNVILRAEPNNANQSLSLTLTSNSTTQVEDSKFKTVDIDFTKLTAPEKTTVNNFINLMKSKLPNT